MLALAQAKAPKKEFFDTSLTDGLLKYPELDQ
jgi:hypothetical protein